jgi:hypothetical protein
MGGSVLSDISIRILESVFSSSLRIRQQPAGAGSTASSGLENTQEIS